MFAAFHIADLPVAAALQQQPEWRDRPCAILRDPTDREDGKIPLLALNATAWRTGIAPGWPLNRALVRCPDLRVLSRDPKTEAALLAELVELADGFTADVEITSPDTVLLDLAGTKRLHFDGLEALPNSDVEVCHALAKTPDLAHFAVLEPRTRGRFLSTAEIGTLPLALLAKLDDGGTFLPLLDLLGLRTLADYCQLPRQDLSERFGPTAGHWHDLISGKSCRLLKLHRPPESLHQSIDFDDAIDSSEALVFIFKRLLQVLASRLAARHLAASVLEIRLRLEAGSSLRREIRLPEPLADPVALLKPVQTLAESLVLPSPVIGLELDATAALPLSHQSDWTKRQLPNPERWADTLARLEALVGSGNVGIPVPLEIHRPDTFKMRDATASVAVAQSGRLPDCSIPLRRFRPPVEISVAFESLPNIYPRPLALLTGPHCGQVLGQSGPFIISGDLWNPDGAWHRLEWDIHVAQAPLLRLVYQTGDRWQLDGIYG
ncbi:MAG: DNA polymerase Y family protein [Verrucomicrobiota bacterium]